MQGLQQRGSLGTLQSPQETFSGHQITNAITTLGERLDACGLLPGDRVLLINDGDIYFPIFYLALTLKKIVVVPCPTGRENRFGFRYLIDRTQPKYAIAATSIVDALGNGEPIHDIFPDCPLQFIRLPVEHQNMSAKLAALDVAALMFTSGTTGMPKGVLVTHQNLLTTLEKNIAFQSLSSATIELNALPLTHSFGLGQLNATLAAGGMGILLPGLANLGRVLKTARQAHVTNFPTTPAGLGILTDRYAKQFQQSFDYLQVIMVNSAPLPPRLAEKIMTLLPQIRLLVYYGLTEASRSTFAELSGVDRDYLSSVGKPLGNTVVSIAEDSKEILIRGDNVSPGYFQDCTTPLLLHPASTLKTGDKGEIVAGGRLVVSGRLTDELNIGGYKIDPLEVERLTVAIEGIQQACLTVVASKYHDISELVLLISAPAEVAEQTIRHQLSAALEQYKMPHHILQVTAVPAGLNGKINRVQSQQMARDLLA
ncbi:MAG: class I adenylate-forming enzyme family protein [Pseudomonadota bacterium]